MLRRWDTRAARSADVYLANSSHTAGMIRAAYGFEAEVLHPPVGIPVAGGLEPVPGIEPGYFLCVSRLLPYKHVDVIVDAFSRLGAERLVVVGSGPLAQQLRSTAARNVTFLERVSDAQLRWLYANGRALVAASHEDFGLTPVEAAAFGTPAIVLRHGGYLETVLDANTGVFFDAPTPRAVVGAVQRFSELTWDRAVIRGRSDRLGDDFARRLQELTNAWCEEAPRS
jgi:glycosyltransferase involved in cell wall biosynthesis